nr:MAG TPA: hypothetical protein [Caudoviricetes sp.]
MKQPPPHPQVRYRPVRMPTCRRKRFPNNRSKT